MSTEKTHTSGPWYLGRRAGNPAVYGKDGTEVAEILHGLTDEWRENARLIESAPDLLSALEAIIVGLSEQSVRLQKGNLHEVCRICREMAEDAIAKAKGGNA